MESRIHQETKQGNLLGKGLVSFDTYLRLGISSPQHMYIFFWFFVGRLPLAAPRPTREGKPPSRDRKQPRCEIIHSQRILTYAFTTCGMFFFPRGIPQLQSDWSLPWYSYSLASCSISGLWGKYSSEDDCPKYSSDGRIPSQKHGASVCPWTNTL